MWDGSGPAASAARGRGVRPTPDEPASAPGDRGVGPSPVDRTLSRRTSPRPNARADARPSPAPRPVVTGETMLAPPAPRLLRRPRAGTTTSGTASLSGWPMEPERAVRAVGAAGWGEAPGAGAPGPPRACGSVTPESAVVSASSPHAGDGAPRGGGAGCAGGSGCLKGGAAARACGAAGAAA